MQRFVLPALLLAVAGFVALPVSAQDLSMAPPSLFQCQVYDWDAQHDGNAEPWQVCSTPQCGCMCPYAGAAVVVDAAGQQRGAFVVISCQSGYGTTSGPSDGGAPITVIPILGGGGLGGIGTALSGP